MSTKSETKKNESEVATKQEDVMPAYLKDKEVLGMDEVRKYTKTPMFKVIQGTSKPDAQDNFGVGSIVANDTLLATAGKPLLVIPVYFWPSWQQRADDQDKQANHFIVEETMDANSEIARKSRSEKTRTEVYADNPNLKYKFCQSLNFAMLMVDGPLAGAVALVKFAMGAHKIGENINTSLKARGTSLFYNQIELTSNKTTNAQSQSWYQLNWQLSEESWTPEAMLEDVERIHREIAAEHAKVDTEFGAEE